MPHFLRPALAATAAVASLVAPPAWAQTLTEPTAWAPQVSLRAGVWSHGRDLGAPGAISVGAVEARVAPEVSANLDGYAEGRLQADSRGRTDADLREGWISVSGGGAKLTVGRQIVVWGRADRINPTDVISSRDYTQLLATDDEQRRGSLMAVASYGAGPWTVSALWLPEFRPNRFPIDGSNPGVVIVRDQSPRDRGQFGLHVDHAGSGLDWSVSYFEGVDRTRDIAPVAVPAGSPPGTFAAVQQQFPDIRVLGADLAGVRGPLGYRAEAAYTHVRGADTPFRKNDSFWAVVGVDRTFDSGWNLNAQYSFRRVFDYVDPQGLANPLARAVAVQSAVVNNQLDRQQNSFTLRAARSWLDDDALSFELAAIGTVETRDVAIRPKLTYAFNDHLRGIAGADVFRGRRLSYFGRVRDASAGYIQIVYGY